MSAITSVPSHKYVFQPSQYMLGYGAILLTVVLWASWVISTKVGLNIALAPFDLAALRYGMPSFIFGYFTHKSRHIIYQAKLSHLLCICFGAGLPFLFLVTWGMEFAPASHAGILVPGTFPLFVGLITLYLGWRRVSISYLLGLGSIFLGVITLVSPVFFLSSGEGLIKGYVLYLSASFCWSLYTVAVHRSRIPALAAAGLFSLSSSIVLIVLYVAGVADSNITEVTFSHHLNEFLVIAFVQGCLVGVLASYSYLFSIATLGPEKATVLSSLTPVVVVIMGITVLGETVDFFTGVAVVIVCFGIAMASNKST